MFMLMLIIGFVIFFIYYDLNIRGTYPINHSLSKNVEVFLNDKNTDIIFQREYFKYFKNGNTILKIWIKNWPHAYGCIGVKYTLSDELSDKKNITYSDLFTCNRNNVWEKENLTYSLRKKIRNMYIPI